MPIDDGGIEVNPTGELPLIDNGTDLNCTVSAAKLLPPNLATSIVMMPVKPIISHRCGRLTEFIVQASHVMPERWVKIVDQKYESICCEARKLIFATPSLLATV
jgi:hypothetical protein